jgi:hypothetical protein
MLFKKPEEKSDLGEKILVASIKVYLSSDGEYAQSFIKYSDDIDEITERFSDVKRGVARALTLELAEIIGEID